MLRVGLTGGIGSGKSTVAGRLAEHGAVLIDADRIAREVVAPGSDGLAEVVTAFGDSVLAPDGSLDRPTLAAIVFADDEARAQLNAIVHPRIGARTAALTAAAAPDAVIVHDVPLLVENRLAPMYHLVIVVDAPIEQRVRRLVRDRGMNEADVLARIAAQADEPRRRAVVIAKESAESLSPSYSSRCLADHLVWRDDPIAEPLMVPFKMVVRTEMMNCIS